MLQRLLIFLFTSAFIAALVFLVYSLVFSEDTPTENKEASKQVTSLNTNEKPQKQESSNSENSNKKAETPTTIKEPTYVNGVMIVNKKHPLPATFGNGENPEAAAAIKLIIADAQKQGLNVSNSTSGYRSYAKQESLYNNYVAQNGKEKADTFSARPGYSEHQSGLAFDLIDNEGTLLGSDTSTEASKKAAKWVEENAHNYGLIVRYKEGYEEKTGYQAEPWHLRYVGKDIAKEIYSRNISLEEYLNVPGGTYNN